MTHNTQIKQLKAQIKDLELKIQINEALSNDYAPDGAYAKFYGNNEVTKTIKDGYDRVTEAYKDEVARLKTQITQIKLSSKPKNQLPQMGE